MPLYEIQSGGLLRHHEAKFADLGVYERTDLQRLLRDDIGVLDPDLLVIAEEFGNWEDSRRRVDLLAIDRSRRLVVIELKRTDDGGHMELQALRYAAMVSAMSFHEVAATFASHLAQNGVSAEIDATTRLLEWLDAAEADDPPVISQDVRIVLVSANFGRELTTAVLWLNRLEGMDIRCVRLIPYRIEGRVLLDIQQVIPLPEAGDYQVRIGRKVSEQERRTTDNRDWTRYQILVNGQASEDLNKRNAVRQMIQSLIDQGVPAAEVGARLTPGRFRRLAGEHSDEEQVKAAFAVQYPNVDVRAWFTEHAIVETGDTWLVRRIWGRATEPTLVALQDAFPEAGVTFRVAEPT